MTIGRSPALPGQLETGRTLDLGAERRFRPAVASDQTAPPPAPEPAPPADAPAPARWRRLLFLAGRVLLLLVLLATMAAWAAQWIRTSVLYVHEADARVKADILAVSSTAEGVLLERLVGEGDRVARGQVLARLDTRAAELALAETDSELAALEAELRRVDAQAALTEGQVEARIATARSQVGEAEANRRAHTDELTYLEAEFRRMEALAASGAVPAARLERARADFLTARQELGRAAAGVAKAEAQLAEAAADRAMLGVSAAERVALGARSAEIAARRQRQEIDLADRTITSPIDGVVGGTFAMAGEYVSAGERLLVLHDPAGIWVETNIRETEVARLEVGQPVRIEVDAYPDLEVAGRVARIGDAATSQFSLLPRLNDSSTFTKVTQRIKVRVDIEPPDARLKPGMMVEVYVDDGSADGFWSWLR